MLYRDICLTNGYTFVHSIGLVRDDVVQLVRHTARFGNVCYGTGTVKLRCHDVVHHTTSVTNLERLRLNSTNSRRTNDGDSLLLCNVQNFTCALYVVSSFVKRPFSRSTYPFRYTFCNYGDGSNLRVFHEFHGRAVDTSGRCKVNHCIHVWMLGHGLVD